MILTDLWRWLKARKCCRISAIFWCLPTFYLWISFALLQRKNLAIMQKEGQNYLLFTKIWQKKGHMEYDEDWHFQTYGSLHPHKAFSQSCSSFLAKCSPRWSGWSCRGHAALVLTTCLFDSDTLTDCPMVPKQMKPYSNKLLKPQCYGICYWLT